MPTMNVSHTVWSAFLVFFKKYIPLLTRLLFEDEFGQWRPVCNRFGAEYISAYQAYVQISPPEEDYDGRLDLYKL